LVPSCKPLSSRLAASTPTVQDAQNNKR